MTRVSGERNMAASIQLDIVWDGAVSGLAAHRISLTAFAPALTQLLAATKRIASNFVTNAVERSETGRLAKLAHSIDLQVETLVKGSGGFGAQVAFDAPVSYQSDLFFNLPERTGIELLESIEAESRAEYRNSSVRQYLHLLPKALTHQAYKLHENGRVIKEFTIGEMKLPEMMLELPYLQEVIGMVTGVGFDPGRNEVRLKSDDAEQVTTIAVAQQVNQAYGLRSEKVRALILHTEVGAKLLTLSDNESRRPAFSEEDHIFNKWDDAFRELA